MVVAVQELEVESNGLFPTEDGDDPLPVQLRSHLGDDDGTGGGRGDTLESLAPVTSLEARADDLEELLRRSLGKVKGDLVCGEELLVLGGDVGGGSVGWQGEEGGDEGGSEGRVVEVHEALGDGKVVGGGKGCEQADEEVEDLRGVR